MKEEIIGGFNSKVYHKKEMMKQKIISTLDLLREDAFNEMILPEHFYKEVNNILLDADRKISRL